MLALVFHFALAAHHWRTIAPGIEYLDISYHKLTPWSRVHAFRINLKQNHLSLSLAQDLHKPFAAADQYARFSRALIAINGGFFDNNYRPLGLRIRDKQQISPVKSISWWGILTISNDEARLTNARGFRPSDQIDFAIQSGPRLIVDGRIPSLKPGRAERTALGITRDGDLIIVVTEHTPMMTTQLAKLMKSPPLNCVQALNLDGGNSSQLFAKMPGFNLTVHGFSNVSDAVIVKPK